MTIRSVDMQVLVQKVGEVGKVQAAQQADYNTRQQETIQDIGKQNEKLSKTVNQTSANQSKLVHEKHEKEKKSPKKTEKRGNKKQREKTNKLLEINEAKGNNIDIKI